MLFEFLITVILILIAYLYFYLHQQNTYWKRNGVPYIPSNPLFGHFNSALWLRESIRDPVDKLYFHSIAKKQPFVGVNIFHRPALLIRDPELVKNILIKDFNSFSDRFTGADPIHDPVGGNNLFQLKNPEWRQLRGKLSPIFTSGKMKQMFYLVDRVASELSEKVASNKVQEAKDLFSFFTVDVISLVAFGTEANCLKNPETSEFIINAKKSLTGSRWGKISFNSVFLLPDIVRYLKLTTFDPGFGNFLRRIFNEVTAARIQSKNVRNDLIDALIAIKNSDPEGKMFTEDILVAQAAVFFVAGFETSSASLSFLFYHLAKDHEVQSKLREEIKEVLLKNDGKMSYENLTNDLPYFGAVLKETLRMYPPLAYLDRECVTKEYSLEPFSDFKIPYKTPILIPLASIQMDPEYYPNPQQFNPSRWEGKNPNDYTFMPFGLGPHNCIGERFAYMQVKLGAVHLLKSFSVDFADGRGPPMELDETTFLFRAKHPINLRFTPDELI